MMDDVAQVPPSASAVVFPFNTTLAPDNARDLFFRRNNLKMEIDQILERIPQELSMNPQVFSFFFSQILADKESIPKNLRILSKVFKHLAQLYADFIPTDEQVDAINYIMSNPELIAMVFGDFSKTLVDLDPSHFSY